MVCYPDFYSQGSSQSPALGGVDFEIFHCVLVVSLMNGKGGGIVMMMAGVVMIKLRIMMRVTIKMIQ